jgi:hypothetical protein
MHLLGYRKRVVVSVRYWVDLPQGTEAATGGLINQSTSESVQVMADLLMILLLLVAFAIAGLYIWACDRVAVP